MRLKTKLVCVISANYNPFLPTTRGLNDACLYTSYEYQPFSHIEHSCRVSMR